MSRSFDRTLKGMKQQLLAKREPMPDFTGWNPADVVLWRLEHGETLQDLVREENPPADKQREEAEAERERACRADEEDPRTEAMTASVEPTPEPKPTPKPEPKAEPPTPEPGMPKPEPQWWEERAHWRQREPRDLYWAKPTYGRCLVEYDVLNRDNGYDPFARYDEDEE